MFEYLKHIINENLETEEEPIISEIERGVESDYVAHAENGVLQKEYEDDKIYSSQTGFYSTEEFYRRLESIGYDYEESKSFIESTGNVMALACAGSGKTTAVILSIIYGFISGQNYKNINGVRVPKSLLVSTFLRTGAEELKQEMREWCKLLHIDLSREMNWINFTTLHGEFLSSLTTAKKMGIIPTNSFRGMQSPLEQKMSREAAITKIATTMKLRSVKFAEVSKTLQREEIESLDSLLTYLSNRLNKADAEVMLNSVVEEFDMTVEQVTAFYNEYVMLKEKLRQVTGVINLDFDDLQDKTLLYLRSSRPFQEYIRKKYEKLYIDEFQDTSEVQYEILKDYFATEGDTKKDIFVVGDDDQCIYSWRGSDIKIITSKYEIDYKPKVCLLTKNRRCPSTVVNFCKGSILKNTERHKKELKSSNTTGEKIQLITKLPIKHWNEYIEDLLKEGKIGLLCRTNNDLLVPVLLMELLTDKNDYYLSSNFRVTGLMKAAFSVIALWGEDVLNLELLLSSLLPMKYRSNINRFLSKLKRHNLTLHTASKVELQLIAEETYLPIEFSKFLAYFKLVSERYADRIGTDLSGVAEMYNYFCTVYKEKKSTYIENLTQLMHTLKVMVLQGVFSSYTKESLYEFLNLHLSGRIEGRKDKSDMTKLITLTTVHDAKGKGWDNVIIYNDTVGHFPNKLDIEAIPRATYEEERRLHYIACTRTKKKLYIMTSEDVKNRSPFLAECDMSHAEINVKYNTQ